MVGVPRSRGCIGCRQQKKKCVVISQPPCCRCERLRIPCAGYGERRFKFQDETQTYMARRGKGNTVITLSSSSSTSSNSSPPLHFECNRQQDSVILTNPTNILTALISSFAHSLDSHGKDTRHNLAWNFGGFLYDVPRSLGSNETLDAAADALVAGYDHFRRSRNSTANEMCLRKYSRALGTLRKSLSTVERACEPATLCAIMIIMVIEALMGVSTASSLQHAGGAATILKCRGIREPKDELEEKLLMSLRGPVVVQAFFLDESYYTPTEWTRLISGYSSEGGVAEESFFDGLAAAARLFQNIRAVLSRESPSEQDVERLISRVSALHQFLIQRISNLTARLNSARNFSEMDIQKFTHGSCTRDLGLTLATQIVVNCMRTALQGTCSSAVEEDNKGLCQEICILGEGDAMYHRPLGSAWILIAIPVAYIGADTPQEKTRVMNLLESYTSDLPSDQREKHAQMDKLETFAAYLSCSDLSSLRQNLQTPGT